MKCPACGAGIADDEQFCTACGAAVARRCPACAGDNPMAAAYCGLCGADLQGAAAVLDPAATRGGTRGRTEAGRRQLTVVFADLVGSTALSARLDPEDMQKVIKAYQGCCARVVERYEGLVAKYMGDGVLAYFGFPQAHEEDAERAVRAALDLVREVPGLAARPDVALQAKVGIATGLVVVGDLIGEGAAQEEAVVGDTPNLAARMQELAGPGEVVIGPRVRRLVGGLFDLADLGPRELKGFDRPVAAWRVQAPRTVDRFAALRAVLTPLVGRTAESALLLHRWERASAGEGNVVVLCGEPGIGKSRIVLALQERLAGAQATIVRYQCLPYYRNSPLQPAIDELERGAAIARDDPGAVKLDKLRAHLAPLDPDLATLPVLAVLLAIPMSGRTPAVRQSPQRSKARVIAALVRRLIAFARGAPVLVVFEDVHWIDPTSCELLERLVDAMQDVPVLVVITQRSGAPPLRLGQANVTTVALSRLGRREVETLIAQMTHGRTLPPELVERVVERSDGVPLFVEELTKAVLESDLVEDRGDHYALTGPVAELAIPETLQDSLTARLDRLGPVKEVAQIAAVIGREFSYELLAAVADRPDPALRAALRQLSDAELVFGRGEPPEATYAFKHVLVQETAYQAVLRERRAELHARIAHALAADFPDVLEHRPELIAQHCTEAGLDEEAVEFWREAGERAIARSAPHEAVAHLESALALLARFAESRHRDRTELELQTSLGGALIATRSFAAPETGEAFARAWELARSLDDDSRQVPAMFGCWIHHAARAEMTASLEVARDMLKLAERLDNAAARIVAHRALANTQFFVGDLEATRQHAEQAIAAYDPARHGHLARRYAADPFVLAAYFLAHARLCLGQPDQARPHARAALGRARELGHVVTTAQALHHDCLFHQLARDPHVVRQQADALIALADEHGLPFWLALGQIFRGWALGETGQIERAREDLCEGLDAYRATGGLLYLPYALGHWAEVCARTDGYRDALDAIAEAKAVIAATGARGFEARIHRIEGELLRARGDLPAAEASFRRSLDVAHRQHARLCELRTAVALADLWRAAGRTEAAHDLVAPLYARFTEGFQTPDLRAAGDLLEQLSLERAKRA